MLINKDDKYNNYTDSFREENPCFDISICSIRISYVWHLLYAVCWLNEFQNETILTTTCLKLFSHLFAHWFNLTTISFYSWRRCIHLFIFFLLYNILLLLFLFNLFRRLNFCLFHFFCLFDWLFCFLFFLVLNFSWFLWFLRWRWFLNRFRFWFLFRLLFNLFLFLRCFLLYNWLFLFRNFLNFFLNIFLLLFSDCWVCFSSLMLHLTGRSNLTFWLFWYLLFLEFRFFFLSVLPFLFLMLNRFLLMWFILFLELRSIMFWILKLSLFSLSKLFSFSLSFKSLLFRIELFGSCQYWIKKYVQSLSSKKLNFCLFSMAELFFGLLLFYFKCCFDWIHPLSSPS